MSVWGKVLQTEEGKRLWLQGTRKLGCAAHVQIKSCVLYLEYAVIPSEHVSKWKLQCLRQKKLSKLKEDIHANNPIKIIIKHFVSLPSEAAHSGHLTGQSSDAVFSQKLHPKVTSKITEMVHCGITETTEVKCSLKYYVDTILQYLRNLVKNQPYMTEPSICLTVTFVTIFAWQRKPLIYLSLTKKIFN